MVININYANRFMKIYKDFLISISRLNNKSLGLLQIMVGGIKEYNKNRGLFESYIKENKVQDNLIIDGIHSINYGKWIYIKSTKKYSILLSINENNVYGVYGLTEPISSIIDANICYIECGLTKIYDKYIIDGIITNKVYIGINMRKSINEEYNKIKNEKGIIE